MEKPINEHKTSAIEALDRYVAGLTIVREHRHTSHLLSLEANFADRLASKILHLKRENGDGCKVIEKQNQMMEYGQRVATLTVNYAEKEQKELEEKHHLRIAEIKAECAKSTQLLDDRNKEWDCVKTVLKNKLDLSAQLKKELSADVDMLAQNEEVMKDLTRTLDDTTLEMRLNRMNSEFAEINEQIALDEANHTKDLETNAMLSDELAALRLENGAKMDEITAFPPRNEQLADVQETEEAKNLELLNDAKAAEEKRNAERFEMQRHFTEQQDLFEKLKKMNDDHGNKFCQEFENFQSIGDFEKLKSIVELIAEAGLRLNEWDVRCKKLSESVDQFRQSILDGDCRLKILNAAKDNILERLDESAAMEQSLSSAPQFIRSPDGRVERLGNDTHLFLVPQRLPPRLTKRNKRKLVESIPIDRSAHSPDSSNVDFLPDGSLPPEIAVEYEEQTERHIHAAKLYHKFMYDD